MEMKKKKDKTTLDDIMRMVEADNNSLLCSMVKSCWMDRQMPPAS